MGDVLSVPFIVSCWDLFNRTPVDMENIPVKLLDITIKRWTATSSFFRRILENYAVRVEKWDVCLSVTTTTRCACKDNRI